MIAQFSENDAFAKEPRALEAFYAKVTSRIRGLDNVSAKQQMLVTLYDRFFSQAFPKLRDRMGIVFTPVEVVDYILRSADVLARSVFGKSLSDEGVTVLDPFTGTGTFLTRLLQIGLIRPEDLERKYRHELFANEIVLLSYYIAAVNIEAVFRQVLADAGSNLRATSGSRGSRSSTRSRCTTARTGSRAMCSRKLEAHRGAARLVDQRDRDEPAVLSRAVERERQ